MSRAGEAPAQIVAAAAAEAVKPVARRPRAEVDVDRIVYLYNNDRMTLRQVAKEVGVSHVTVARRINEKTGQLRGWRLPGER